jgi:hypothetical protein
VVVKTLTPIVKDALIAVGAHFHGKGRRAVSFEIGRDGGIKGTVHSLKEAEKLLPKLVAASRENKAPKGQKKKTPKPEGAKVTKKAGNKTRA